MVKGGFYRSRFIIAGEIELLRNKGIYGVHPRTLFRAGEQKIPITGRVSARQYELRY